MSDHAERERHAHRASGGAGSETATPAAAERRRGGRDRAGGQQLAAEPSDGSGFCAALNTGLCTSAHETQAARAVIRELQDADSTRASTILVALNAAQRTAPCGPSDTTVGVELTNRTVVVGASELPGLIELARLRSRQLGGTGADPARDVVAGEGNTVGVCSAVPGENTPLPADAAGAREAMHAEIAALELASTALITHFYDYVETNWIGYLGYTQQQRQLPWQRGEIMEFLRGKLGSLASSAGTAAGRALGNRIPVPFAGALLGRLGGFLVGHAAEWLIDQATGRAHDDNDYRERDTQIDQARATATQVTRIASQRDAEIARASTSIAELYRAPLGQMVDSVDFNRLHFAVQHEHLEVARRAAAVHPEQRDMCQQMVRAWAAGMAVGGSGHRAEVDDPTFARARNYGWSNQTSFAGQTDLFIEQARARCAQLEVDAGPWLAELRDLVHRQGVASAERVRAALGTRLTGSVTGPQGAETATMNIAVEDGAVVLVNLHTQHRGYAVQDNNHLRPLLGIERPELIPER